MDPVSKADILIAGVGHELMGDDALGHAVLAKLEQGGMPSRVRLLDAGPAPQDILAELSGIKKLIVVDALTGVEPGRIVIKRLPAIAAFPEEYGTQSHGISLVQTLCLARELAPEIEILIIGVGIAPAATPGQPLSDSLRKRIPALIALIDEELRRATHHS